MTSYAKQYPELAGSVAFVTGAANGQGKAAAIALASQGMRVACLDVAEQLSYPGYKTGSSAGLDETVAACKAVGGDGMALVADVRDSAAVAKAVASFEAEWEPCRVLFNNAGICAYGRAHELSEEAWDAMIDINLKGAWLVAKHGIPGMIKRGGGVILNNSSVGGLRGMGPLPHYAASKWGLTGLSKSLAIDLAPHNIRVISLHPTGVNTPMNDGLAYLEGSTPQEIAERSAGNLLPVPWIEPEDVAHAVLFLASDHARYMTGNEFVIDAGLLTR